MNEIAAVIYLQMFCEKCEDKNHILYRFNNFDFIEHDTYQIFERMFNIGMQNMFIGERQEKKKRNIFIEFMQDIKMKYSKDDISANPVIKTCHEVFEVCLNIIDPELFTFLNENGVEAHLFLL